MNFDIEAAKEAGYSDAEITDYLAKEQNFDAEGARAQGYSDAELVTHLTAQQGDYSKSQTHDGRPARENADGSYSTEVSITVTDPRLNEGQPTNIPSMWGGEEVDEGTAVENALKAGKAYPSYQSIDEAVKAAQVRSDAGGATVDQQESPQESSFLGKLFSGIKSSSAALKAAGMGQVFDPADRFQSGISKGLAAPFVGGAQLAGEAANLAGAGIDTQSMVKAADEALGDSSGVAGAAGEVAGTLINPLYRAITNRFGLPAKSVAGAGAKGVATGSVSAALNPTQEEEYWAQKALETGGGAVLGGSLGVAFGKQVLNTRTAVDDAFKNAQASYNSLEELGLKFRPVVATKTTQDITKAVEKEIVGGLRGKDLSKVRGIIRKFRMEAGKSDGSLAAYERLKQQAALLINSAGNNTDQKKAAYIVRNAVENMLSTVDERAVKAGSKEAIAKLKESRGLFRAASRANVIQQVMDEAKKIASAKGGVSYPKALAQQLEKLALDDKVLAKNFSAKEIAALRKLSKGSKMDTLEGALNTASSLLGYIGSGALAYGTGGVSALAIPVAASVGKRIAARGAGAVREEGLQGMLTNIIAP